MPYARGKAMTAIQRPAWVCSVQNIVTNHVAVAGTTGLAVNKPLNVWDFSVLYAFISRTSFANTAHFTCGGWTQIGPAAASSGSTTGNDRQMTILRKVITDAGAEPASYTFVTSAATSIQICGIIVCVNGANNATPEDIALPAYGLTSNSSAPASLAGTSATAGALVIQFCQVSLATAAAITPGAPSTYSGLVSVTDTTGSLDNQSMVAYKTLGAAGSAAGTNAWTNSNDGASESLTGMVMVRPRTV